VEVTAELQKSLETVSLWVKITFFR